MPFTAVLSMSPVLPYPLWHLQLRILLFRFLLLLQRQLLLVLQHLLSALCMLHPSQLVLLLQPSSRFPVSFSRLHPLSSVLSHRFHRMLLYSSHAGLQIFFLLMQVSKYFNARVQGTCIFTCDKTACFIALNRTLWLRPIFERHDCRFSRSSSTEFSSRTTFSLS